MESVPEFCALTPKQVFLREATGLVREISPFGAFVIGMVALSMPLAVVFAFSSTPAIFGQVHIGLQMLFMAGPVMCWAFVYLMLNAAMPRSGGDYVWLSRIVNPPVGFMASILFFFTQITWLGVIPGVTILTVTDFLVMSAVAFHSPFLVSIAVPLSTPLTITSLGMVALIITAIIFLTGIGNTQRVLMALFIVGFIGFLSFLFVLFTTPNNVFVTNFNNLFGTNAASNLVQVAEKNGYSPGWSVNGSLAAGVLGIENMTGFVWAIYAGGELKKVTKASWMATVVPGIIGIALYVLTAYALYGALGYDFISGVGYLYNAASGVVGPSSYLNVSPVSIPSFYVAFLNANPYLVAFIGFSFVLGVYGAELTTFLLVTRMLFAYSFDRILPTKFAMVSDRFHTPAFSILVCTIGGAIFTIIANYTNFYASFFGNVSIDTTVFFMITAIAAIKFPYGKTKHVFDQAPSIVRKKLAGIPIVVIAGTITFITFLYATYQAVTNPSLGGTITPSSLTVSLLLPLLIPIVIYYASKSYHRSKGLDITLAFQEIPPE